MENIELLNGDCLELMNNIKDKSIDMILTDLPFGTTRNQWDSVIPLDKLWTQYKRIIKDNGAIVLFAQTPFDKVLGSSNIEMLKYEWIWEKENGTGFLNAKKMPMKIHENILVFYKNPPTYKPQMRTGFKPYVAKQGSQSDNYGDYIEGHMTESNGERYPVDVLKFNRDKDKYHPTQKPVKLLQYLILTYTNENETVLDSTMGSGSTAVACINANRKFIGIELNEDYFNIAQERVQKATINKKYSLF